MFEHALAYAGRGWHVFTLTGRKTPFANCDACRIDHTTPDAMEACECLHCHGFYAATTDPARVRAMLATERRVCLAIRTGAVSGLAVVDVDIREWTPDGTPAPTDAAWQTMSGLDARRLLPGTVMASTAGGGLHMVYGHPGGYLMSGTNKYGPGIDSKADGGYIVAAPSVNTEGAPYRWTPDDRHDHPLTPLPEELAAMVRPPAAPVRELVSARPTGLPGTRSRLRGLVDTVLGAAEGERNDMLHWASKKAGEMIAAGEVDRTTAVDVLRDAGVSVGLSPSEVGDGHRGTIASGLRKGTAAGVVA